MQTKSVLETIFEWSKDRPLWMRDALRRIVLSGIPTDDDLKELSDLCKKEHGDQSVLLESKPLDNQHLPKCAKIEESVSLLSIKNVKGVNQLAEKQELEFEPDGLTIIYGRNGTGKSGYSRILKKACRARQAGEIMPDVFKPTATGNATAQIVIQRPKGNKTEIDWEDNSSAVRELSTVTVFDRESGSVHIREKNEVWFRPFGLDIPDELAQTCKKLQTIFESEKKSLESNQNVVFGTPIWSKESTFGKVLSNLKHDTDLETLKSLPEFSSKDEAELAQLTLDLAKDSSTTVSEHNRIVKECDDAVSEIKTTLKEFSDDRFAEVQSLSRAAKNCREASITAARIAFAENKLSGVGEEVWRRLWESAREYSNSLGKQVSGFPPTEKDPCVLCQQPIQIDTQTRMAKFENFIKGDLETKAQAAERDLKTALDRLVNCPVHIRQVSRAYGHLRGANPKIAKATLRFFARAKIRKCQMLKSIENKTTDSLVPFSVSPVDELNAYKSKLIEYANSLLANENSPERIKLKQKRAELSDRKRSPTLLKIAEVEIERLKCLRLIEDCERTTNTSSITRLGNKIADEVMTPQRKELFRNEISALAKGRIHVEIVRAGGGQGSPRYQVKLLGTQNSKVSQVLSEGEQSCVALAAYLTELANATHRSSLVFDDPVSSLDHKWRKNVAVRLVKEASLRQVVVFSHDLVFINDLLRFANNNNIAVRSLYLSRSNHAVGYVNDNLPWYAGKIKQRVRDLHITARKARIEYDQQNEEEYRNIVSNFYSRLRATWEHALEEIVFQGVIKRFSDYIDTRRLKKVTGLEEDDVRTFSINFQKCNSLTDAHDASGGHDIEPPTPDELEEDINTFSEWSSNLGKKLKNVK